MTDELFCFHISSRVLHKADCAQVPADARENSDWISPHSLKNVALDAGIWGKTAGFTQCGCVPLETWEKVTGQ